MKFCYDDYGNCYRVPNWAINDPFVEKEYKELKDLKEAVDVTIYITEIYKNEVYKLTVNQSVSGRELKKIYLTSLQEDVNKYRLRLIFNGSEIQDDHTIFSHGVCNESKVQLIKNLID